MSIPKVLRTGVFKSDTQRPGVYIDNADAIVWAADLRKLLKDSDAPQTCRAKAVELAELLESVK